MKRSRPWFWCLAAAWFVTVNIGCHESSGAQPNSVDSSRSAGPPSALEPARPAKSPPAVSASAALPSPVASAALDASPPAAAESPPLPERETSPQLLDEQGKPLAQTDQRPTLASASFQSRVAAVARAIISGDVEPALPAFFPLVAYQQVKDVAKPERDYRFRLLANFKRDLLEYHRVLGAAAAESKFEGITVSEKDVKWMAPGSEGNKLGYFRVLRSRLRFTLPTGRSRELELTSLISWRGEWYVVHLHGFK
ncbi:MAG TPA: hypothetical protein VGJ91_04590 [Polyangiaceae bacterium]